MMTVPDQRIVQKGARRVGVVGDEPGNEQRVGKYRAHRLQALGAALVDEVVPVEMQAVEEEGHDGNLVTEPLDVEPAAEPAHGDLEGVRGSVRTEGDRLTVEHHLPGRSRPAAPSVRAASITAPRSPRSIRARRTVAAGTPVALATASVMTPSRAPCRNSPASNRRRKCCSPVVAR